MKKLLMFLFLFVCAFALVFTNAKAAKDDKKTTKEEKVEQVAIEGKPTLYFFRRTGCSHCADELRYLGEHYDELKKKINIVVYDYYANGNQDITIDVVDALNVNQDDFGFPFNVIGSKQFMGFADTISDDFDKFIDDAIKSETVDIVATLINQKNYENLQPTTLQEAIDEEGIELSSGDKKSNDGLVIAIFFGVIALGLTGLVIYSRKQ